jgi:hypothetical protein
VFGRLVEFLNRPDSAGVVYRLGHTKPESVMVEIALPGWHWEVDVRLHEREDRWGVLKIGVS